MDGVVLAFSIKNKFQEGEAETEAEAEANLVRVKRKGIDHPKGGRSSMEISPFSASTSALGKYFPFLSWLFSLTLHLTHSLPSSLLSSQDAPDLRHCSYCPRLGFQRGKCPSVGLHSPLASPDLAWPRGKVGRGKEPRKRPTLNMGAGGPIQELAFCSPLRACRPPFWPFSPS